eukprot:10197438-Lingulodinium_polyedra.AAC.1
MRRGASQTVGLIVARYAPTHCALRVARRAARDALLQIERHATRSARAPQRVCRCALHLANCAP